MLENELASLVPAHTQMEAESCLDAPSMYEYMGAFKDKEVLLAQGVDEQYDEYSIEGNQVVATPLPALKEQLKSLSLRK